jgi:hypothetical protein
MHGKGVEVVKHGTVFGFVLVVVGIFSWADFGDAPLDTKVDRLYTLTIVYLCFVFGSAWYREKNLSDRLEKLERAAAARENPLSVPNSAKE